MIHYKEGYKYQLVVDSPPFLTVFRPLVDIDTEWIHLGADGILIARAGYAYDGPSGPTFDTPDSMQGSLAHDMLYQLMGLGLLPLTCKDDADHLLRALCIADGMPCWRADAWYEAVKLFGVRAAETPDIILTAPLTSETPDHA